MINSLLDFTSLGCWKDTRNRAIPHLERTDPGITGNYQKRKDAITKCMQVAKERGMAIFAVQNGGRCAGDNVLSGYKKYGRASNCKDGKGGSWANDVYRIIGIPVQSEY